MPYLQRTLEEFEAEKLSALMALEWIPGIGIKIVQELWNLGSCSIQYLKNEDPKELYFKLYTRKSIHIDLCLL